MSHIDKLQIYFFKYLLVILIIKYLINLNQEYFHKQGFLLWVLKSYTKTVLIYSNILLYNKYCFSCMI